MSKKRGIVLYSTVNHDPFVSLLNLPSPQPTLRSCYMPQELLVFEDPASFDFRNSCYSAIPSERRFLILIWREWKHRHASQILFPFLNPDVGVSTPCSFGCGYGLADYAAKLTSSPSHDLLYIAHPVPCIYSILSRSSPAAPVFPGKPPCATSFVFDQAPAAGPVGRR